MAFRPPPSNLACPPHVRPPLRLSFTLISNAMGCTEPEAVIDQFAELPPDMHKADGLESTYSHDFILYQGIALEHTHWLLHVLHVIPVIFSGFIHRGINALGSLTLNGVVTRQPASCQHSYIGSG